MLRQIHQLAEHPPVRALRRPIRDRQRQFEERYAESFAQMRERRRSA